MRRFITLTILIISGFLILSSESKDSSRSIFASNSVDSLYIRYSSLNLEGKLSYEVFSQAMEGYHKFNFNNDQILTIIDFTKISTQKRFFVIDLKLNKLIFESLVAHGKNSGNDYAKIFSNKEHSLMSSPGFYETAETYQGEHGYSLRLDGLEEGINDHARERAIVIHAAKYVSEQFIQQTGHLGRSWGCPALPTNLNNAIIDCIKNGTCLYIYTDSSMI